MDESVPKQESLTIELKSDVNRLRDDELIEAVVALANTEGGVLYLGVEDDGTITGLHADHDPLHGLASMVAKSHPHRVAERHPEGRGGSDEDSGSSPGARARRVPGSGTRECLHVERARLPCVGCPFGICPPGRVRVAPAGSDGEAVCPTAWTDRPIGSHGALRARARPGHTPAGPPGREACTRAAGRAAMAQVPSGPEARRERGMNEPVRRQQVPAWKLDALEAGLFNAGSMRGALGARIAAAYSQAGSASNCSILWTFSLYAVTTCTAYRARIGRRP